MTYQRLSNLELVLARKKSVNSQVTTEIFGVPVEEDEYAVSDCGSGLMLAHMQIRQERRRLRMQSEFHARKKGRHMTSPARKATHQHLC